MISRSVVPIGTSTRPTLLIWPASANTFVPELPETDQWTEFKVDFTYVKDFDLDILDQRGYNLAVVFSSSIDGAYFQGAVGSTLDIDQVRLICETVE